MTEGAKPVASFPDIRGQKRAMKSPLVRTFIGLLAVGLGLVSDLHAQGMNYVDESGNIFFVDRLEDVPMRYRSQLIPPTPTLPPGSKIAKQYEAQVKRSQKEQERIKKRQTREKELARKRAEKEKVRKEREEARAKKRKKKQSP